ncbi:hypothetical protein AB4212_04195 [Streptomyces sp. 2MCAF27]
MRALSRKVDQIDTKLDHFLNETREIKDDLDDHEKRLRALETGETERQRRAAARLDALESGRWPLPTLGVLAGLVGAGTGLVALLGK